jgi:hypothetical protein
MKFLIIILSIFSISNFQCRPKGQASNSISGTQITIIQLYKNGYFKDTSFKLIDTSKEAVFIKYFKNIDSTNLISVQFFIKENDNWTLGSKFDSLIFDSNEIITAHADYNGDSIVDYSFKYKQAPRGANSYYHILFYLPNEKRFMYLKNSNKLSSPWYDYNCNCLSSITYYGLNSNFKKHKIYNDSIVLIKEEIWDEDKQIVVEKNN